MRISDWSSDVCSSDLRGEVDLLRQLAEFCIWRDFPELLPEPAGTGLDALRGQGVFTEALFADWFAQVCERTAATIAHWMRVGFVHGVLNTDNLSILGLTIHYGPDRQSKRLNSSH